MARQKPKIVLVDGYNVIRSCQKYRSFIIDHDPKVNDVYQRARPYLIADAAALVDDKTDVVVVFDAAQNTESQGRPVREAGIVVYFSPYGAEADELIEQFAHEAQALGKTVFVVTSDMQTQRAVFRAGVTRISARAFCAEMTDFIADQAEYMSTPSKNTIANRIDPDVAARLKSWSQGRFDA